MVNTTKRVYFNIDKNIFEMFKCVLGKGRIPSEVYKTIIIGYIREHGNDAEIGTLNTYMAARTNKERQDNILKVRKIMKEGVGLYQNNEGDIEKIEEGDIKETLKIEKEEGKIEEGDIKEKERKVEINEALKKRAEIKKIQESFDNTNNDSWDEIIEEKNSQS